ncbi:MAG TPA: FxsA family protein [Pseudolabrys sp.]|jgi:UPF0716 protein FxsA|nr:FxsA family protein [Pseudolabrys sp.]
MINVAKYALLALLALPFLELAVFVAVTAMIGFGWALSLVAAGSTIGLLILRHAGGSHIARMRVALDQGSFTALQVDTSGGAILMGGILLLIPGFITDIAALCLLIPPLRHAMFGRVVAPARNDGIVDLPPEQWHQVPDPSLPDQRRHEPKR